MATDIVKMRWRAIGAEKIVATLTIEEQAFSMPSSS